MHTFAAAGAGFLLAVLWFDLMFDVQTRKHTGDLPPEVLASISAYYRRVTTEAYPMNRLVALVMVPLQPCAPDRGSGPAIERAIGARSGSDGSDELISIPSARNPGLSALEK
jgi:hypothetical protein